MKGRLLTVVAASALAAAASGAASAASPRASCVGIGSSSLAGEPGARAAVQADVDGFAASLGLPNRGAVYSANAHEHEGSVEACFQAEG
jgi:hypothetical protein